MPLIVTPCICSIPTTDKIKGREFEGFLVANLSILVMFETPEVWEYFRKPENYINLYDHFDKKIKEVNGAHWKILKEYFRPNFEPHFKQEEYLYFPISQFAIVDKSFLPQTLNALL